MDTQPDRPSMPSAALLAFADELDDILDPTVVPPAAIATITHMARERARSLTDGPGAAQVTIRCVDEARVHAAMAAAVRLQHQPYTPGGASEDVLDLARVLEHYVRGDR